MKLNYNDYLTQLNNDDVVDHQDKLFKVDKLKEALNTAFDNAVPQAINTHIANKGIAISVSPLVQWFENGVNLKILQANSKGWKEGKLKINISIEFIPNNVEEAVSPLDEIRREIDQANN